MLRGPLWRPWDFYVVPVRGALADRADGREQERGRGTRSGAARVERGRNELQLVAAGGS